MRIVNRHWLLLLAPVLLASCAMPVRIESRVDPDHVGGLERVYVISRLHEVSDRFAEPCERLIVEELTSAGVEVQLFSVDPLALDDTLPIDDAAEFSPEAVLILKPTEKGGPRLSNVTMASVNLTLLDLADDAAYWRATFKVQSGDERTPMGTTTARQFAKALVQRLLDDGLLGPSTKGTAG